MTSTATTHTHALLLFETKDGIATVTLNRPGQFNALSTALIDELQSALDRIGRGPERSGGRARGARPRVLRRSRPQGDSRDGRRCGSRGALRALQPDDDDARAAAAARHREGARAGHCGWLSARRHLRPGRRLHGGDLCDARRQHRRFCATPSVALGRAVGRKHAMEMLLTGDAISAERAHDIGLVNRVVPPEALDAEVESLARLIASKSSTAIATGKHVFYRQLELPLDEAYGWPGMRSPATSSVPTGRKASTPSSASARRSGRAERTITVPALSGGTSPPTLGRPPRTTSARVVDPSRLAA